MAEQDGIRSIADARRAGERETESFDSGLWARLAHAGDAPAFAAAWLDIQCRSLERVARTGSLGLEASLRAELGVAG